MAILDLRGAKNIVILGGGTAGWFAALTLRRLFSPAVNIQVIESTKIPIVGVGEGGLLNFINTLERNEIDVDDFIEKTGATYKWGFSYEGWRGYPENDRFYHLFADQNSSATKWQTRGFFPLISGMIAKGVPLHFALRGSVAIHNNATQEQAKIIIKSGKSDIRTSLHFDSYKTAQYLKDVALARGVTHIDTKILNFDRNEAGNVCMLKGQDQDIPVDFVIDASGLHRKIIGQMDACWHSFSEHLLMDSAIPFYMPHPQKNPLLVTRAIAMPSGWMWQIPLQHRVGAGYVFSSKHSTPEQAAQDVQTMLGFEVEIQRTIRFESGCFEKVWIKNVMALGLSSGFVEPLEATSIGQMLEQLRNLERMLMTTNALISEVNIQTFNEANHASWLGIRDFLRMHYDVPRKDNAFWQDVSNMPMPQSYLEFKEVCQHRSPRELDILQYVKSGWDGIFHPVNWIMVAAPLGIIPNSAARNELLVLSKEEQLKAYEWTQQFFKPQPLVTT